MVEKYGAYYEGAGGDKSDAIKYQGSWDDKASKEVKGYPKEFLYTLFTNSNVNNQKKNLTQPDKTIFDSALAAQGKWGYFKDRKFDADTLKQFLSASGMLDKSKQPATESNVKKFIDEGEGLMWPKNWEEYPNPAGKLAQKASEYRTNWLKSQKEGVYFVGSDHMKELNKPKANETAPSQLAKALARQDSVTKQPRNRFFGAVADAAGYLSDQADRYVVPERDPLFGGMRGGDLLPLRNVNRLLDDLSYGGRITTGRGQTTTLRPEVVDTVALGGAMMPVAKSLGKAALREGARQIETGTGIGRAVVNPRSPITTWHGSPHTFPPTANNPLGEFDPMKVGTGEGAQAYGTGAAYLAEAKKLAEGYAGANAGRAAASDGLIDLLPKPAQMEVYKAMQMTDGPFKKAKIDDIVSRFPESSPVFQANTGNLYKVDLPDEHVAKMLNWDKPLSEQHPSVQSALAKLDPDLYHPTGNEYSPDEVGAEIYLRMANSPLAKNQSDASEVMRNAGITGIRYLDAASRDAAGKGTSNFVVFDPKHMNILERNGVGGAMIQRPKTEFEILHDTAQRNAALPVEQGGLGLPAGNTAMDRAGAMGFDTPAYHGTNADIKEFDLSKHGTSTDKGDFGKAVYVSTDNSIANSYAKAKDKYGKDISGANVMPLSIKENNVYPVNGQQGMTELINKLGGEDAWYELQQNPDKYANAIKDLGYDSVRDYGYKQSAVFEPKNIRSRFAAFDPFRRHEADILAGVGVGGMLDPQAIAEALRQQDRK
jgi:hypothetical protein